MSRKGEDFKKYACRRATDIARGIKGVMGSDFEIDIANEDQADEFEAQIETLVLGFNMMCSELRRLDGIARTELDKAMKYIEEQEKELEKKLRTIEMQNKAIRELSTPVLQTWDQVLALPIIGVVDTKRSQEIMEVLLKEIISKRVFRGPSPVPSFRGPSLLILLT